MCPGLPPTDGARDFLILFYANISFVKYTLDCPNAVVQIIIARINMIVLIIFYCFSKWKICRFYYSFTCSYIFTINFFSH